MIQGEKRAVSRRRVLQSVAAGLTVAGLGAGTASATPGSTSVTSRRAQATKIVFSATGDANVEQPVFRDLIEMFNSSQSEVVVEYQPFPEGGYEKAIAMLQAGTVPDIMRIDDDAAFFIGASGRAHELTPYMNELKADDYFPYLFHELAADGKIFAISMCDAPWTWIYNKQMYDEAGIAAPATWEDAWSWEATVENFGKLVKKEGDFTLVYAGMVGHGEEMPYEAGVGHYNHDMTRANFNHPLVVDAMRRTSELQYKEQIALPPGAGEEIDLFNAAQLATISQVVTNAVSLSPDIEWDFAATNKSSCYAMGAPYSRAFIMPKDGPAKNPDAVWKFFSWYLTSTEAQERVAAGGWGVPPLRAIAESPALADSAWAKGRNLAAVLGGLEHAYPRAQTPFADAVATNWKSGALRDQVMLGDKSPEEFCEEVQQLVQSEIDQALSEGWQYVPPPHAELPSTWTQWYYAGEPRDDDPRLACGLAKDDPAV